MGLDIYIYRVRKPAPFENRIYDRDDLLSQGFCVILPGSEDERLVRDVLRYTQPVKTRVAYLNIAKVRRVYELSDESYVCAWHANGGVGIFDPAAEGRTIDLSYEEIESQFMELREEDAQVFMMEEVAYWRKNYEVQDFFYDALERVENTGYYCLDASVLHAFNEKAKQAGWTHLPEEAPTEDSALVYWEWY